MEETREINLLFEKFKVELHLLSNQSDVLNLKASYLGKSGSLSEILKSLKSLSNDERRVVGPHANNKKVEMIDLINEKLSMIEIGVINKKLAENRVDLSYRDSLIDSGLSSAGYHPITVIQREIEDLFITMGFEIVDGPHIEDEYHNFVALNIPENHPARDMQDTFWFNDPSGDDPEKLLLRTHTSSIQVRGMRDRKPPFRFIAPGKVFRAERTDASHDMVFHQLEGMMVGEDISVSNLIYFMKMILGKIFKKKVEIRLRPGFFPFVEPGFELDIRCLICRGKGCSVCKHSGWVELLPCGMIHPNVLKAEGIDTNVYNGFAFGMGLDRLVMMRYGIDNIRHFHGADLRFISQFKSY